MTSLVVCGLDPRHPCESSACGMLPLIAGGSDVDVLQARHPADQRQAVPRDGTITGLPRADLARAEHRRQSRAHGLQALDRTRIRRDARGVDRQRAFAGDRAHIGRAVDARKHLRRVHRAGLLPVFEKKRLGRNSRAGLEHEAVTFQSEECVLWRINKLSLTQPHYLFVDVA